MSIPDYDGYVRRVTSPWNRAVTGKVSMNVREGRTYSMWNVPLATSGSVGEGAVPSTAVVPTSNTIGALGTLATNDPAILNGTNVRLLALEHNIGSILRGGVLWICDRLSHQGGLSGTVTTPNTTTNLPTAALTRYASGAGVWIMLEIYSVIGNTATTITCTYTNDAGTGGRVTPLTVFGSTGYREAGRSFILPLQAGDTGVRSIESYTLTSTTGAAGSFGFSLIKPLALYPMAGIDQANSLGLFNCANMPVVEDDACLQMVIISPNSTTGAISCNLILAED